MHRRTALVLALGFVAVALVCVLWNRRPSASVDEMIETTLAEIARGDVHRVNEVRDILLRDSRYAKYSRLLGAAALLATAQPQAAFERASPFPQDPALRWRFQLVAAKALHALGRYTEAEPILQDITRIRPNEPDALRWLGMVYYDLGAMEHAVIPLMELSEMQPDDYRPHWLLGIIYHDVEQYALAIKHFRSALDRAPPQVIQSEIQEELARSLVSDGRFNEALEVLAPDPATASQMQLIARCYFNLGETDTARSWADKAAALDPAVPDLALLQAELLAERGEIAAAIRVLQQATEQHPHDPALRHQYSQYLRINGQIAEAAEQLQLWDGVNARRRRLVELNEQAIAKPYDRAVREELAMIWRELNEPKMAEMWQRAAESLPSRSVTGQ